MNTKCLIASFMLAATVFTGGASSFAQVSGSTLNILLQDGRPTAEVNGGAEPLNAPARMEDGAFYIPIRWMAETLDLPLRWDAGRHTVGLTTGKAYVEWNLAAGTAAVNGRTVPFPETALLRDDSLLVNLDWIADYVELTYTFEPESGRVELYYVRPADAAYRESTYPEDNQPNSRPVALFATDKAVYRIGEPVRYIDLSYDPDAEGLPEYDWTGKQDVFFEPGDYTVKLRVRDGKGNWSKEFARTVTIGEEKLFTEVEYAWHTRPIGTAIGIRSDEWEEALQFAPELTMRVTDSDSRPRIVSGHRHTIRETGLVHEGTVNGRARLVSHHVNGMDEPVQFMVAVRNPSRDRTLRVQLPRLGELQPTLYHAQIGREAVTDFMSAPAANGTIEVAPGQTEALYSYSLEPGHGFASLSDIETDGEAEVGFVALRAEEELKSLGSYAARHEATPDAPGYSLTHVYLDGTTASNLRLLSKWTLDDAPNDGSSDTSALGKEYALRLTNLPGTAIAVKAKSGTLNGVLKVNGVTMPLPPGGITDRDGPWLLCRTSGAESDVVIEWMAAPDHNSPIEWIFYPLHDHDQD